MTAAKIHSTHCERIAFVYVRQSTWLQVLENRESTERQYNLFNQASHRAPVTAGQSRGGNRRGSRPLG